MIPLALFLLGCATVFFGVVEAALGVDTPSSARTIADALSGRSAGSLPRHCMTMVDSDVVTAVVCVVSGRGCSARCAATSACMFRLPANGCCPASSSYAITPNA